MSLQQEQLFHIGDPSDVPQPSTYKASLLYQLVSDRV